MSKDQRRVFGKDLRVHVGECLLLYLLFLSLYFFKLKCQLSAVAPISTTKYNKSKYFIVVTAK